MQSDKIVTVAYLFEPSDEGRGEGAENMFAMGPERDLLLFRAAEEVSMDSLAGSGTLTVLVPMTKDVLNAISEWHKEQLSFIPHSTGYSAIVRNNMVKIVGPWLESITQLKGRI